MKKEISDTVRNLILTAQKDEITEYHLYSKMARKADGENRRVLEQIARDELDHYEFWEEYTGKKVKPGRLVIWFYYLLSFIFGLTFTLKLFENNEEGAQLTYEKIAAEVPEAKKIIDDEGRHEDELIAMIEEERLDYVGSMVLGLNDALVELTGTLAGLTFAMRNTSLIALAGMITGVAASLSMAASQYLSTKSEAGGSASAVKSALYTGVTYIITVVFLILPYLLLDAYMLSLLVTVLIALLIILIFNFYVSVAKDYDFKRRFLEMALISFGVAFLSFFIGYFIRAVFGVEI